MEGAMQIDNLNANVEFKDIDVDENSIKPSQPESTPMEDTPLEGEITSLGIIPVPVIGNREAMIRVLEEYQDDTRFVMAILRAATIDFSPLQRNLIERIEQEYEAWYSPTNTNVNLFDTYVIELRDDFFYQEALDEDFYEEQKRLYLCVYRTLSRFPFPYSDRQMNLLESFKDQLDCATGDPSQMADISLIEDLQSLLSLMEAGDHANNDRFYVDCTVEYYVQEIVDELRYPVYEESARRIPSAIPEGALINIATYVKDQLISSFNGCHYESHVGLYHLGLSEIHNRLVVIFRQSGLPLSEHQGSLLSSIMRNIGDALRNQNTGKYEDLHLGFYGFMDSLRRDHPVREQKVDEGYKVIDEEGVVAKAVEKVMKDLDDLRKVAEDHHKSFSEYSSSIPEITKIMLQHFTRIYPPGQSEPITVTLPNGFYASVLSDEWFKRT